MKAKIAIIICEVFLNEFSAISYVLVSILDHISTFLDHFGLSSLLLEDKFDALINDFGWIVRVLMVIVFFQLIK